MPRHQLTDAVLDGLEVRPNTAPHHLLTVLSWAGDAPPEGAPCRDAADLPGAGAVFRLSSWSVVPTLVECAARRRDWSYNAFGFHFAHNADRDDPAFPEVLLVDARDEVEVSYAAFDRVCARAFDALEAFAGTRAPEVTQSAWWPTVLAHMATVRARAR